MIRSEHLQFAAMLVPTLVLFVAMLFVIVVPEDAGAQSAARHAIAEVAVMDTEIGPLGTIVVYGQHDAR